MKNRFEHEINMGRHFLSELESYLERDEAKELEAMMERYYTLKQESNKVIETLQEELKEARLKISQMGMERGKLLKEVEEYKAKALTKANVDRIWNKAQIAGMRNGGYSDLLKELNLDKSAEPDATGRP